MLLSFGIPLSAESVSADVKVDGTVYEGDLDRASAFEVMELVNAARTKQGLQPLTMDLQLMQGAEKRAAELSASFSHMRPDGSMCFSIMEGKDVYAYAENIAAGYFNPDMVMDGWMNSPGHYANIMGDSYTTIGVGCFYKDGTRYWTQLFGYEQSEVCTGMYRLYNPNSGEHFYTGSVNEKHTLVEQGWKDEALGWVAPRTSSKPVYRLYNSNAGDHHYTQNKGERNYLLRLGWSDEGIGWYSDSAERYPLYRQYNPNASAGSHNYTTSKGENDWLAQNGWNAEGIGWYAVEAGK